MTPRQETQRRTILTTAYTSFEKKLNLHAFLKVADHALGEDLVQNTFIKTWAYLVKGGKIDIMKAFLYHVLNNLIVDEYRKHKTTSLDILMEKGFEPSDNSFARSFNILDGKATLILIQNLPEKYKKVMLMRYVQDLSLKEMSVSTKQSEGTIAVQLHRGLEKLKRLYSHT